MKNDKTELKPCPFCGGKAIINWLAGNTCITCTGCMGAIFPASWQTKEEAVEAWNRRWTDVPDINQSMVPETEESEWVYGRIGDDLLDDVLAVISPMEGVMRMTNKDDPDTNVGDIAGNCSEIPNSSAKSTQPEPKTGENDSATCMISKKTHDRTTDDLISRQVAIAYACSGLVRRMDDGDWRRVADIREDLLKLPSAQPELIRCKECALRDGYGCCRYWKGQAMSNHPVPTDDYDFCSMAKRRGDG